MMQHKTHINDCVWFEPKLFTDNRGVFSEIFKYSIGPNKFFEPKQCNYSFSHKGVLRGIHRTPYSKYVTCVSGKIYDVCVDLRINSSTYNQYFGIILDSQKLNSLYIPSFCGHAFLALEDSILIYQQDQEYNPNTDETYCYKQFNINWPEEIQIISNKDNNACI